MDADNRVRVVTRQNLRHQTSPIAAVCREMLVTETLGHQLMPEVADLESRARVDGGVRKCITGQAWDNDVECVRRIAAMTRGIGEHRDDLCESQKGIGKAVRQDDR